MPLPDGARIAIVLLCAGAVLFLLRVLYALVQEGWRLRSARKMCRGQFKLGRVSPIRRRQQLIVVDTEKLRQRFGIRAETE